jgi:hypothetical protein
VVAVAVRDKQRINLSRVHPPPAQAVQHHRPAFAQQSRPAVRTTKAMLPRPAGVIAGPVPINTISVILAFPGASSVEIDWRTPLAVTV